MVIGSDVSEFAHIRLLVHRAKFLRLILCYHPLYSQDMATLNPGVYYISCEDTGAYLVTSSNHCLVRAEANNWALTHETNQKV